MQNLSELQLEAIMQHLRLCPKDLSPNKDYILGLVAGMEMYHVTQMKSHEDDKFQEEILRAMEAWEPDPEDTLEEADFVRTTS